MRIAGNSDKEIIRTTQVVRKARHSSNPKSLKIRWAEHVVNKGKEYDSSSFKKWVNYLERDR